MKVDIEHFSVYTDDLDEGIAVVRKHRLYNHISGIIRDITIFDSTNLERVLVAYHKKTPIGCLTVDDYIDITAKAVQTRVNTWVKPYYRGKGVGTKLLSATRLKEGFLCYGVSEAAVKLYSKNTFAQYWNSGVAPTSTFVKY